MSTIVTLACVGKPLLNHILTEFISMWLHESLRGVQEDFSVLVEHGSKQHYFPLCLCLFHKLESLCAVNWVAIDDTIGLSY